MLNKVLLTIFAGLFSINCYSQNMALQNPVLKFEIGEINIRQPFTSMASAKFSVKNISQDPILISQFKTESARHVDFFESYISKIGAEQVKRSKGLLIEPGQQVQFSNNLKQKVLLTGLKRTYFPGEEIILQVVTSVGKSYNLKFPVVVK